MKKRKKLLLLLCAALLLTGGCGSKTPTDGNSSTANNADTSSGADISVDTPLYSLLPDRHGVHEASGDGSEMLLSGYYDTVSFQGDGFDALGSAVAD